MKYLGGKHGIGNDISQFLFKVCPPDIVKGYLEPFCGSLGVFKHMTNKGYNKYIASDLHPDLIEMWKKIQNNSLKLPKNISEKDYEKLKHEKSPNALKAVAGFGMSFGGVYFQSYAQKYAGDSGRNFYQEMKRSLDKIAPFIQKDNVNFYNKSYKHWNPNNMLIYCDPPYENTSGYSTGDFNHVQFWDIIRKWSKNNYVFISEENAPKDFKCVWKRNKRRTVSSKKRGYKLEKLFVYKEGLYFDKMSKRMTRRNIQSNINKKKHKKTHRNTRKT